jgi:uncharacterized membrane protein YgcG
VPELWSRIGKILTGRRQRDPLLVRTGSTRKRDAYKTATAGVTGITAFGALAVTGAVAGTAAHNQAEKQADTAQPAAPAVQVVTKRRKHRTVVRTRVVHAVSTAVSRPATGGTVSSSSYGSSSSHSSGGHTSGGSSGGSTTHSAPKPAAPAPAPSSGS